MENVIIDENYVDQTREQTPTELFNTHLLERDDDPGEEIKADLDKLKKEQPQAFNETNEVIQNFILDAFDEEGSLFRDASSKTGTTISMIYGKLREIAFKHLMKITRKYDSRTRALLKMHFIQKVDVEIFDKVRHEAVG
jgi:hypothetical protein